MLCSLAAGIESKSAGSLRLRGNAAPERLSTEQSAQRQATLSVVDEAIFHALKTEGNRNRRRDAGFTRVGALVKGEVIFGMRFRKGWEETDREKADCADTGQCDYEDGESERRIRVLREDGKKKGDQGTEDAAAGQSRTRPNGVDQPSLLLQLRSSKVHVKFFSQLKNLNYGVVNKENRR